MQVTLIQPDGTRSEHTIDPVGLTDLLRSSQLGTYTIANNKVMVVDRNGFDMKAGGIDENFELIPAVKVPRPLNPEATAMYRAFEGNDQTLEILGEVAIVPAGEM